LVRVFVVWGLVTVRWLVVARWVEGQLAQELAGCLADDPDVQVLGEDEDSVPAWARPTPMWWSLPAWRRVTVPTAQILSVRTRSWVSVSRLPGRPWAGGVGGCGGLVAGQGAVPALAVVDGGELVEKLL